LRFVGIDVAAERHVVAVVDETGTILLRATPVTEDTPGYQQLRQLLGRAQDCLVAMAASGHYWRKLYAALVTAGFDVALLNPLRTRRFAEELARALIEAATQSVGAHHGEPYRRQVRYACEDIDLLRRHLRALERDLEQRLAKHQVGELLTTIDGIGPQTAACIMVEVGDPPDLSERLAAPLARDGDPEPVHIEETDTNFAVAWTGHYRIMGTTFIYSDLASGRVITLLGYPTDQIAQLD
jgi:transposase